MRRLRRTAGSRWDAKRALRLAEVARAEGLPLAKEEDLDPLLEDAKDSRVVMLGEASHGTSEYYAWRHRISLRLIREHGFNFIAVEGDWPDCYAVNRYVKGRPTPHVSVPQVLSGFDRWPTWMWANREVQALVEDLRDWNASRPEEEKTGFYGLDVYSLWDSIHAVLGYLETVDPEVAADAARRAHACFEPYGEDVQEYAWATRWVGESCEDEVVDMLAGLRERAPEYREDDPEAYFSAEQNALVARNAERYYRAMVRGGGESWNVRDRHMTDTLERLLDLHGPEAKGIVWAHNTHVGDATYTDMAASGMVNIGSLARERHGRDDVRLVGFASHRGFVVAGREWDAPMERMRVPEAAEGSLEDALHLAGAADRLLLLSERDPWTEFPEPVGHRAIGVVYDPDYERFGNYVPTVFPERYDALLYLDETRALSPLKVPLHREREPPETFPTGL